jgi:myo-inositol 2-dehydrogenase/D-chiro-inositol 1-dehydrogenase/scyllo-inositol 2-dehydrogenase (NAD+)
MTEGVKELDRVNFVLVGAGRAGMVHARNLVHYIPEARLCALVDLNPEQAKKSAEEVGISKYYTRFEEALEKEAFEAVCIASLTFTHREIIEQAARAGKHIFCEKPLAQTRTEAERIREVVRASGVKFQIGFMRRYDPGIRKAWEMVREGKIGQLVLIKSTGRGPGLPPDWIWDRSKSGGMLAEVSSHDVDAVLWFAGQKPDTVFLMARNFKGQKAREKFTDFYDHYVLTVNFQDGPMGVIDGGCPVGYAYDARMEILGTEGMIRVGETDVPEPVWYTLEKKSVRETQSSWRNRFKEGYLEEMKSFIRCILQDEQPSPSLEDGFRVVEVVETAHQSLQSGKPVAFEGEW